MLKIKTKLDYFSQNNRSRNSVYGCTFECESLYHRHFPHSLIDKEEVYIRDAPHLEKAIKTINDFYQDSNGCS